MFSDILTPLPAMGIEFDVVPKRGPIIPEPIRRSSASTNPPQITADAGVSELLQIADASSTSGQALHATADPCSKSHWGHSMEMCTALRLAITLACLNLC